TCARPRTSTEPPIYWRELLSRPDRYFLHSLTKTTAQAGPANDMGDCRADPRTATRGSTRRQQCHCLASVCLQGLPTYSATHLCLLLQTMHSYSVPDRLQGSSPRRTSSDRSVSIVSLCGSMRHSPGSSARSDG